MFIICVAERHTLVAVDARVNFVCSVRSVRARSTAHSLMTNAVVYSSKSSVMERINQSSRGDRCPTAVAVDSRVQLVGEVRVVWSMVGGASRLIGMARQDFFGFAHETHFKKVQLLRVLCSL